MSSILFHATSISNAASIRKAGFRVPGSLEGVERGLKLGAGVYFGADEDYCREEALNSLEEARRDGDDGHGDGAGAGTAVGEREDGVRSRAELALKVEVLQVEVDAGRVLSLGDYRARVWPLRACGTTLLPSGKHIGAQASPAALPGVAAAAATTTAAAASDPLPAEAGLRMSQEQWDEETERLTGAYLASIGFDSVSINEGTRREELAVYDSRRIRLVAGGAGAGGAASSGTEERKNRDEEEEEEESLADLVAASKRVEAELAAARSGRGAGGGAGAAAGGHKRASGRDIIRLMKENKRLKDVIAARCNRARDARPDFDAALLATFRRRANDWHKGCRRDSGGDGDRSGDGVEGVGAGAGVGGAGAGGDSGSNGDGGGDCRAAGGPSRITDLIYLGNHEDAKDLPRLLEAGIARILNVAVELSSLCDDPDFYACLRKPQQQQQQQQQQGLQRQRCPPGRNDGDDSDDGDVGGDAAVVEDKRGGRGGGGGGGGGGPPELEPSREETSSVDTVLLHIPAHDDGDYDLAQHFAACAAFLREAAARGEATLIHCHTGRSRSAAVTVACLMILRRWTLFEAYTAVFAGRDIIGPNKGFMKQLWELERRERVLEPGVVRVAAGTDGDKRGGSSAGAPSAAADGAAVDGAQRETTTTTKGGRGAGKRRILSLEFWEAVGTV